MSLLPIILTIIGLCAFETINSVDNAIINADVLSTMDKKYRKWFLVWGLLIAVFAVRGLFPLLIVWMANPSIGIMGAFWSTLSSDPIVVSSIQSSTPVLLMTGGVFLLFLFLHWIFAEPKNYALERPEKFLESQGMWFISITSVILLIIVWITLQIDTMMAFGAILGSTVFYVVNGLKKNADRQKQKILDKRRGRKSAISKLLYLEVLDGTFSFDGILGAFAFTVSVPLIMIGNGLGAIIVRQLTVKNIDALKKLKYLKNGAMYSIFFLSMFMIVDSFGEVIPSWLAPISTLIIIGIFLYKSIKENKKPKKKK